MLAVLIGRAVIAAFILIGGYHALKFFTSTNQTSTKKGKRNVR